MIIYKITNILTHKIYIGQTIRGLHTRINEYKSDSLSNNPPNTRIFNSIRKYGFENFIFEIIDTATTIDELNEKEVNWIKFYNSTNKSVGYNIMEGGRNSILSDETKEKMSFARKGRKQTEKWISKRVAKAGSDEAKKYGKEKTDEERKYLSENSPRFWLNKNRSAETKKKISLSKKGQLPINCKKVQKIDVVTKEVLEIYNSTSDASKMNPSFSQSKISRICNNKAISKESFTFVFGT